MSDRIRLNALASPPRLLMWTCPLASGYVEGEYERYDWRGRVVQQGGLLRRLQPSKTGRKDTSSASADRRRSSLTNRGGWRSLWTAAFRAIWTGCRFSTFLSCQSLAVLDAELSFSDTGVLGRGRCRVRDIVVVAARSLVDRSPFANVQGGYDRRNSVTGRSHVDLVSLVRASLPTTDRPLPTFSSAALATTTSTAATKRYHETYSLPGADLNEIPGRNFVKSMVELNLPPLRFDRFGTSGFYVPWLRPAVFTGGLATDLDNGVLRRVLFNSGAQVDLAISALSALDLTLSFGAAIAVEDGHGPRHEWMISLKVLR
jgi:hypothetical protein